MIRIPLFPRGRRLRPRSSGIRHGFRPQLEALEVRAVPTNFTVLSLADSGEGTLRQAILDANATPGDDTIDFQVTGTINLAGTLPTLDSNIDIQGPGAGLTVEGDQLTLERQAGSASSLVVSVWAFDGRLWSEPVRFTVTVIS